MKRSSSRYHWRYGQPSVLAASAAVQRRADQLLRLARRQAAIALLGQPRRAAVDEAAAQAMLVPARNEADSVEIAVDAHRADVAAPIDVHDAHVVVVPAADLDLAIVCDANFADAVVRRDPRPSPHSCRAPPRARRPGPCAWPPPLRACWSRCAIALGRCRHLARALGGVAAAALLRLGMAGVLLVAAALAALGSARAGAVIASAAAPAASIHFIMENLLSDQENGRKRRPFRRLAGVQLRRLRDHQSRSSVHATDRQSISSAATR